MDSYGDLNNRFHMIANRSSRRKTLEAIRTLSDCGESPPLKDIRLLEAARERDTIRIIVVATSDPVIISRLRV